MADTPRKFTVSTTAAVASPPVLGAYDATALTVEVIYRASVSHLYLPKYNFRRVLRACSETRLLANADLFCASASQATASSCRAGVRALGGWTVSSTHGTIYAEAAVEHTTKRLCE